MMYYKDEKHRIQADMALRIGKIAVQYSRITVPPEQDFTDTLHLCLLQTLLTNCKELIDSMARENGEELGLKVPLSEMYGWGLNPNQVNEYSFEGDLTVEIFLIHLRNAMSHPTGTDLDAKSPSTGYNSLPTASCMIRSFGFCNSHDTANNKPLFWSNERFANRYLTDNQRISRKSPWNMIPSDVQIGTTSYNRFGMFRFGEPYARIFLAVLTTDQLLSLLLGLANLLAQPAIDHWNGKTIVNIIAA